MMQWFDKEFNRLTVGELFAILKLRAEVFNGEQQSSYPDPDDNDQHAHHVFAIDNGKVIAYARYFKQDDAIIFGRVVVASQARGIGLGGKIVEHLLTGIANNFPHTEIVIHAQAYVEQFYQKYDFKAVGDHFIEAEREHVMMIHEPLKKEESGNYGN
ncbi:GNAT family N-acetyltransferase [Limosilactobacillus agrestis]|uniref:GNAT family N-acetyltransferase n=1 Tax=Limosilactobacillus agrestis TaxID=2759748 RepID=A0ABS8R660_9LACO|nr:GNAT family N-acetyltransferase [Limosilactobacillus agrestis]MCD7130256.1 GNAT family N-acetyltransferase [Limosilactobacillus agrestis]